MKTVPLFEDPVLPADFEHLVRELDELLRQELVRELEPALEDLLLQRLERGERAA